MIRRLWLLLTGWCFASSSLAAVLQTPAVRFEVSPQTGHFTLTDLKSNVAWAGHPSRFGRVTLTAGGQRRTVDLSACEVRQAPGGMKLLFRPAPDQTVTIDITPAANALAFSYESSAPVESVRLLDEAFAIRADDSGYLAVPVREGLLIPADSGLTFNHTFDTYAYEGCHMAMLGLVKRGSAMLITWDDPYTAIEVRSHTPTDAPGQQSISTSLVLRQSARSATVRLLGAGDYVTIAQAYRAIASQKGYLVTWDQKLAENPQRARYLGAINYKLWSALDRRMNEDSTREERVTVNWTFDEAAQIAEHLKNDLKLDRVLFIVGGFIHRGYDNQHPDILPAAPECGGNDKLAELSRRVRALGYVFSLHDNYQDMYKDAPSWDESYLQKRPDGTPVRGGKWAGGYAYITCSKKAVELARRPQNLPAVKKLTDADSYFIDTTYAAGLQECFDPQHPLTRLDDMKWKQEISDYARKLFGSFGSECGREWAVPHADFFEGLTGVSGTYYHDKNLLAKVGGTVIPLFELVYRDCLAMYGKYGYDIHSSAEYVLHHISIGRPLHYHSIPRHIYWKQPATERPDTPAGMYVRGDGGWTQGLHPMDRFVKNTYEILSPLNQITSRMQMTGHKFLTADRKVRQSVFGTGAEAVRVIVNGGATDCRAAIGSGQAVLPPNGFVIESPTFVAFCALSFDGLEYRNPTCFAIRSMDGKPLEQSAKVRVYHAFGDQRVRFGGAEHSVRAESILER